MTSRLRRHRSADPARLMGILTEQLGIILWTTDRSLRLTSIYDAARRVRCGARKPTPGDLAECDEILAEAHRQALLGHQVTFNFERGVRTYGAVVGPQRDRNDRLLGTIGIAVDITDSRPDGDSSVR